MIVCGRCENEARGLLSSETCLCGPNVSCSLTSECPLGGRKEEAVKKPEGNWPRYVEGQTYVRDSVGVIWLLLPEYDGGMATTATVTGPYTVGITVLRRERGPLLVLDKDNEKVWDNCPRILPDCDDHEPKVVYSGPYGEGANRHMRRTTICGKCDRTLSLG